MTRNYYDSSTPKYTWGDNWRGAKPSEKQIAYAEKLATDNNVKINWNQLRDRGEVSVLIDDLKMGYRRGFGTFRRSWIATGQVTDLQEAQ
jgi:hypothetical protein